MVSLVTSPGYPAHLGFQQVQQPTPMPAPCVRSTQSTIAAPTNGGQPIVAEIGKNQNMSRQDVTYEDRDKDGRSETAVLNFKGKDTLPCPQGQPKLVATVEVNRDTGTVRIQRTDQPNNIVTMQHRAEGGFAVVSGDLLAAGDSNMPQDNSERGMQRDGANVSLNLVPGIGDDGLSLDLQDAIGSKGFVLEVQNETSDLQRFSSDVTVLGVGVDVAALQAQTPECRLNYGWSRPLLVDLPPLKDDFMTIRQRIEPAPPAPVGNKPGIGRPITFTDTWSYVPDA